jgi:hypothetical protein
MKGGHSIELLRSNDPVLVAEDQLDNARDLLADAGVAVESS